MNLKEVLENTNLIVTPEIELQAIENKIKGCEWQVVQESKTIAYCLLQAHKQDLAKKAGYKNTAVWAEEKFGYKKATVYAYIKVAKRFGLQTNKNTPMAVLMETNSLSDSEIVTLTDCYPKWMEGTAKEVRELVKDIKKKPDVIEGTAREVEDVIEGTAREVEDVIEGTAREVENEIKIVGVPKDTLLEVLSIVCNDEKTYKKAKPFIKELLRYVDYKKEVEKC